MSGYLFSLVQRARGEGAALQPRVRARFEPAAFTEVTTEIETAPPRVILSPVEGEGPSPVHAERSFAVSAAQDDPGARAHVVEDRPSEVHTESIVERTETPPVREAPPGLRGSEAPRVQGPPLSLDPMEPRSLGATVPVETTRLVERHTSTDDQTAIHTHSQSHTHTESHTRSHTTERMFETEPEAEPAIHITIGRIDVRAIAPPPAARPPAPAPRRDGPLTLDDYLRRRDGGKR